MNDEDWNKLDASGGPGLSTKLLEVIRQQVVGLTFRDMILAHVTDWFERAKNVEGGKFNYKQPMANVGVGHKRTISFIHQSAKDFLLREAAHDVFPSGIEDIHHTVFSRSLHAMSGTLQRDIYSFGAPGYSIDNTKLPEPDPLAAAGYACVYWVDHLYDWQSSDNFKHPDVFQDGGIVDDFLRQHYLHWLEALSLCRSMSQGILSIVKLESILQVSSTLWYSSCHLEVITSL
jgi:hypothetical protein